MTSGSSKQRSSKQHSLGAQATFSFRSAGLRWQVPCDVRSRGTVMALQPLRRMVVSLVDRLGVDTGWGGPLPKTTDRRDDGDDTRRLDAHTTTPNETRRHDADGFRDDFRRCYPDDRDNDARRNFNGGDATCHGTETRPHHDGYDADASATSSDADDEDVSATSSDADGPATSSTTRYPCVARWHTIYGTATTIAIYHCICTTSAATSGGATSAATCTNVSTTSNSGTTIGTTDAP